MPTEQSRPHGVDALRQQHVRRVRAGDRLPPLATGRRDPLRPATDAPTRRDRFSIAA